MIRLGIRVRAADAELTFARLLGVLGAGAEEVEIPDGVEYALYGPADALPGDGELRALAGEGLLSVARAPVAPGWERAWHAHLERVEAGGLGIRPPWVAGPAGDLVIDPGLSFGVAGHPTTRLCLELLGDAGGPLCDWGTGCGVLAVAAARRGYGPVTAVEVDPAAAATARANAAANRVAVEVRVADLTRESAPWAPTVVANLTMALLESVVFERPPERLIASGVLAGHADRVARALRMAEVERREAEGWAALVLEPA